jgi:hypothetical protein
MAQATSSIDARSASHTRHMLLDIAITVSEILSAECIADLARARHAGDLRVNFRAKPLKENPI